MNSKQTQRGGVTNYFTAHKIAYSPNYRNNAIKTSCVEGSTTVLVFTEASPPTAFKSNKSRLNKKNNATPVYNSQR
jgi:hypothetical protein